MGQKKTTTTTTIPSRSAQEQQFLNLLQQFAQGGVGQLGDLSQLAQGQIGSPSGADAELIAQSIGRARQAAEGQLQASGALQEAQLRESIIGRSAQNSTAEAVGQLLNQLGTQQSVAQAILQAQQQGGEALINLPFQRANTQIGANQALFQRIIGGATPGLSSLLQERIAQPTKTESTSGFGLGDLTSLGSTLSGLNLGSLAGIFGGGPGQPEASGQSIITNKKGNLLPGFF